MHDQGMPHEGVSPEHLAKVLNSHGDSFHYAVVHAITSASDDRWGWSVEDVEVPVEVKGGPIRIDILLKHKIKPAYLVAECKRVNSKLSKWCFLRAPYSDSSHVCVEVVKNDDGNRFLAGMHSLGSEDVYGIAHELKTHAQGDPTGDRGKGAIEDAATQVLRHLNGFVGLLARAREFLEGFRSAFIMPVIFTTAKLFTCDADLSRANLFDGNLDLEGSAIKEVSWLLYRYHQSPGLKHEIRSQHRRGSLSEFIAAEFSRTIAVVSATGVEEFLNRNAHLLW